MHAMHVWKQKFVTESKKEFNYALCISDSYVINYKKLSISEVNVLY
jgi:hypothetical protein